MRRMKYTPVAQARLPQAGLSCQVIHMGRNIGAFLILALLLALAAAPARAQAPSGPLTPKPGADVQQPPKNAQAKLKVQVALVNTPVTVRNARGEMVHNLEAQDFQITDNGAPQQISHFDLGGDPISMVILVETSSRIAPLLPAMSKTGIVFTQTIMGPSGEAAVVGFNDSVDKLQEFTTNSDVIENTIARLKLGTSGSKLYDAMTVGVEMLTGRPQATPEKPGRRRVLMIMSEATDQGSSAKLGEVLRQAQLANVTIYSVGLSTTSAEIRSKPKDTRPEMNPPGTFPLPPFPGSVQTPTTEDNRSGNIDLMAAAVWAVQHIHDAVTANALEVATTATGGVHLAAFKDRTIEKAIDEIGGELHSQYTISYTPTDADVPGYHEIKVNVLRKDAKNLKVRARPGYYLAQPEG
jgi:VWFA-related protein